MRSVLILGVTLMLSGCFDVDFRNRPEQQVEDYKKCRDAGMSSYLDRMGGVHCDLPNPETQEDKSHV